MQLPPRMAAEMPHARQVVLPGAGHMANMETPEVVNRLILEFLAQGVE